MKTEGPHGEALRKYLSRLIGGRNEIRLLSGAPKLGWTQLGAGVIAEARIDRT